MPAESIYLYHLVPPAEIVERVSEIAEALLGADRMRASGTDLEIAEASGMLTYLDRSRAWKNDDPEQLPRDGAAAEEAARAGLERARRMLARVRPRSGGATMPSLFPDDLRRQGVGPVFKPGTTTIDHWNVELAIRLPTGERPRGPDAEGPSYPDAPVDNGGLDVRVGAGGAVIGLVCRWRPYRRLESVERSPAPQGAEPPTLVYVLADEDERQDILAPYWRIGSPDAEDAGYRPASPRSPVVEVEPKVYVPRFAEEE